MKNKIFLFPLSLAVIFFASFIIMFSPVGKKTIIALPTPSIAPIPTDWETYTNKKYGFEFKYPQQYSVSESFWKNPTIVVGENASSPSLIILPNRDSQIFYAYGNLEKIDLKIDGLDVYKQGEANKYFFFKENILFEIDSKNDNFSSQILSTFKFIN